MEHPESNDTDQIALSFASYIDGSPSTCLFPMTRLRNACPRGPKILDVDLRGNIRLDGMNPCGQNEQFAFSLIRKMLNGEDDIFDHLRTVISPRVLFYTSELYVWLGSPLFTFAREASV